MDEMRTLTCPICGKFVLPEERLIIENFGGEVVFWHVKNWQESSEKIHGRATANFSGWCGRNFGRAENMPNLTS